MLRRFHKWLGRFLGFGFTEPAEDGPETVLVGHKDFFRKKIAAYDRALASRAAYCEVLRQQIVKLETEGAQINKELEAQARGLAPDSSASELALRLETQGKDLADLRTQLITAEQNCADLAAARDQVIQEARAKMAELKGVLGHERITQALSEMGSGDKDSR